MSDYNARGLQQGNNSAIFSSKICLKTVKFSVQLTFSHLDKLQNNICCFLLEFEGIDPHKPSEIINKRYVMLIAIWRSIRGRTPNI